jgi:tetratricopeptide (TPR) repeat protein
MPRLNLLVLVAAAGLLPGQGAGPFASPRQQPATARAAYHVAAAANAARAQIRRAAASLPAVAFGGPRFATVPPPPSLQGDPADSLYKLAREHLNQGQYRQAAALFRSLVDQYGKSRYAPDALYWQAFALYRLGGTDDLHHALDALREQEQRFPDAATRGDAQELATRINGVLARSGDIDAAMLVAAQAGELAGSALEAARPALEMTGEIAAAQADAMRAQGDVMRAQVEAVRAGAESAHAAAAGLGGDDRLPPGCPQDDQADVRLAALNALLQMDADQAVPILREVLARRDSCSAPLRRKAVFLLAQKQTPETADLLLDLARHDPDPGVRGQAVFWLSQVPGEKSLKLLEQILADTTDHALQEKALLALSQHEGPEAQAALRTFAANPRASLALREKAVMWIGQGTDTQANAAFLRDLYGRTDDAALKQRILMWLSQMHGASNARFLLDVARDPAQPLDVRKKALFWAGQSSELPTAEIARLYDAMPDSAMKEQLIFALGQRKDGIDKLIQIARNEKNPRLQARAVFWLGQSRDPRAAEVLKEIITR